MDKRPVLLVLAAAVLAIAICGFNYHPVTTSSGPGFGPGPGPRASTDSSAPTTSISYTPTYTSGSKKWVTSSTSFTLSPNSYATGYAEDFESWASGATITGTNPNSGGSWSVGGTSGSSYFVTMTGATSPDTSQTAHFYDNDASNELKCTFTPASSGPDTGGTYIQFSFMVHTCTVYGVDIGINTLAGNNICWFGMAPGDTPNLYYFCNEGGFYFLNPCYHDTWYTIRMTVSSGNKIDFGYSTDLGNTWYGSSPTYYNNGGSHYTAYNSITNIGFAKLWFGSGAASGLADSQFDDINPSWGTITNTYYKWSGSGTHSWAHYTAPFTMTGMSNGTYTINYCSYNDADHPPDNETLQAEVVRIDTVAPTTSIGYSSSYSSGGKTWISGSATISLTGTDATGGSGVAATWYRYSGSSTHSWSAYSTPFSISGNGTYTIYYCSWDNVNNNETLETTVVRVDVTTPTTTCSYTPAYTSGSKNWVASSTVFTLGASDNSGGSGLKNTYYKWSGTGSHAWTSCNTTFTMTGMTNGTYTIYWCSWDHVGNNETLNNQVVYIDTIAPTTTCSFNNALSPRTWTFENQSLSDWTLGVGVYLPTISTTVAHTGTCSVKLDGSSSQTFLWKPHFTSAPNFINNFTAWICATSYYTYGEIFSLYVTGGGGEYVTGGIRLWTNGSLLEYTAGLGPSIGSYSINQWIKISIGDNGLGICFFYVNDVLKGSRGYIQGSTIPNSFCIECPNIGGITGYFYADDVQVSLSSSFVSSSTTFFLPVADNSGGSGIASTHFKIWDNTTNTETRAWQAYSATFTLNSATNGTYSIIYDSKDNVGNNESLEYTYVFIDAIAPTQSVVYSSIYNASVTKGWIFPSATITLSATENAGGSGLAGIGYRYPGKYYGTYSAPFSIASNGTYQVVWSCWDNAGNNVTSSFIIRVDAIKPTPLIHFTNSYNSTGHYWVTGATTFTIVSIDNTGGSGIAASAFKVWNNQTGVEVGTWQSYSISFTLGASTNGTYTICHDAVDNVGNNGTLTFTVVYIDAINPVSVIHEPSSGAWWAPNLCNSGTRFSLAATDTNGSGVDYIEYKLNAGGWVTYTGPFTVLAALVGSVTIYYRAHDNVGNVETIRLADVDNIDFGSTVTVAYSTSFGHTGLDFFKVRTTVNGTNMTANTFGIPAGGLTFNLTVYDLSKPGIVLYSHVLNVSATGPYIIIYVDIANVQFNNKYSFGIKAVMIQGFNTQEITLGPGWSLFNDFTMGNFTAEAISASGAIVEKKNVLLKSNDPDSLNVTFGWMNVTVPVNPNLVYQSSFTILLVVAIMGVVGVVFIIAVAVTTRRRTARRVTTTTPRTPAQPVVRHRLRARVPGL